jgi:membrane-associated phospholipid phosphatase
VADVSIHVEGGALPETTGWLRRAAVGAGRALAWPFRWLEAHPIKGSLFGGYLAALYLVMRRGIFYDRERLFPWLFVGIAILALGTDWRRLLELVVYWVPFFLLWVAYDLIRGQADNGRAVHVTGPIDLEKALFLGKVPNNVLQDRLYDARHIQWWEVITGVTYMSHFFVVYVTAAVLFLRSKDRFVRWMTALVVLTVFGLLGYWLFPMAPPWMAANNFHLIPDIARPGTRGLNLLHLTFVSRLWTHGANNSEMVNPVAAMPSLHAGYSMLFSWFFFKRTRRWWVKALLALYPLLMAFTLVFGGEHYMIDIFAGWLLAILAVEMSDRFHDWRQLRRVRAARTAEASIEDEATPISV